MWGAGPPPTRHRLKFRHAYLASPECKLSQQPLTHRRDAGEVKGKIGGLFSSQKCVSGIPTCQVTAMHSSRGWLEL